MMATYTVTQDPDGTPRIEMPVAAADALAPGDMVEADGVEQRVLAVTDHMHAWKNDGPFFKWAYIDLEPNTTTEPIDTGRKLRRMHEVFRHDDGRVLVALYHTSRMEPVEGNPYSAWVYLTTCRSATAREIGILEHFEQSRPEPAPYFGMQPWDPALNDWVADA